MDHRATEAPMPAHGLITASIVILAGMLAPAAVGAQLLPYPLRPEDLAMSITASAQLSEGETNQLVTRFMEQLDPRHPNRAVAAIDLLTDAPQAIVDGVRARLETIDLLDKIYQAGGDGERDQLWNSTAIGKHDLRGLLDDAYGERLAAATGRHAGIELILLASVGDDLRRLPPELSSAMLAMVVMDDPAFDQSRAEFLSLLRRRADELTGERDLLAKWASGQGTPARLRQELQRFATFALVRMKPM
jgi:hypothetical protein